MEKNKLIFVLFFLAVSCKIKPGSDRNNASADKVFKLRLKPIPGSKYDYEVSNQSTTNLEVQGKKIDNISKTDAEVLYSVDQDSAGNFVVDIKYEKLHIYSKKNGEESDVDAAKGATSSDPTEKMLNALTAANIVATVTKAGEVLNVTGYREVANEVLGQMNNMDISDKKLAQQQWQQLVEDNMIRKNMDQVFKIFPDSAVHVGDQWKLIVKEKGEISFNVRSFFTLKSISDGIAHVESTGDISSDSSLSGIVGYQVSSNLTGKQTGEYDIDIHTGMLVNCQKTTDLEGSIEVMGRKVPLKVRSVVKMKGKKM